MCLRIRQGVREVLAVCLLRPCQAGKITSALWVAGLLGESCLDLESGYALRGLSLSALIELVRPLQPREHP